MAQNREGEEILERKTPGSREIRYEDRRCTEDLRSEQRSGGTEADMRRAVSVASEASTSNFPLKTMRKDSDEQFSRKVDGLLERRSLISG